MLDLSQIKEEHERISEENAVSLNSRKPSKISLNESSSVSRELSFAKFKLYNRGVANESTEIGRSLGYPFEGVITEVNDLDEAKSMGSAKEISTKVDEGVSDSIHIISAEESAFKKILTAGDSPNPSTDQLIKAPTNKTIKVPSIVNSLKSTPKLANGGLNIAKSELPTGGSAAVQKNGSKAGQKVMNVEVQKLLSTLKIGGSTNWNLTIDKKKESPPAHSSQATSKHTTLQSGLGHHKVPSLNLANTVDQLEVDESTPVQGKSSVYSGHPSKTKPSHRRIHSDIQNFTQNIGGTSVKHTDLNSARNSNKLSTQLHNFGPGGGTQEASESDTHLHHPQGMPKLGVQTAGNYHPSPTKTALVSPDHSTKKSQPFSRTKELVSSSTTSFGQNTGFGSSGTATVKKIGHQPKKESWGGEKNYHKSLKEHPNTENAAHNKLNLLAESCKFTKENTAVAVSKKDVLTHLQSSSAIINPKLLTLEGVTSKKKGMLAVAQVSTGFSDSLTKSDVMGSATHMSRTYQTPSKQKFAKQGSFGGQMESPDLANPEVIENKIVGLLTENHHLKQQNQEYKKVSVLLTSDLRPSEAHVSVYHRVAAKERPSSGSGGGLGGQRFD